MSVKNWPIVHINPPDKKAQIIFFSIGEPGEALSDILEYSFLVGFKKIHFLSNIFFHKNKNIFVFLVLKKFKLSYAEVSIIKQNFNGRIIFYFRKDIIFKPKNKLRVRFNFSRVFIKDIYAKVFKIITC